MVFHSLRFTIYALRSLMKEWVDRVRQFDLSDKPLTAALLNKAPLDIERIERNFGFSLDAGISLTGMLDTAVAADVLWLLLPPLIAAQGSDRANGSFPRDRILAFVCSIWFFTSVIPRLEQEGNSMDITRLSDITGTALFEPYGEENRAGLVKIGVQYWKELGAHAPQQIVEWHNSFAQMIFIHYEALINDMIDLGDLDLDGAIGKMVTIFLSMSFKLPDVNAEN